MAYVHEYGKEIRNRTAVKNSTFDIPTVFMFFFSPPYNIYFFLYADAVLCTNLFYICNIFIIYKNI